jgi:transposase
MQGSAYSERDIAQVLALTKLGETVPAIVEATGLSERTVQRWRARWREDGTVQDSELGRQDQRISLRAGYIVEDVLDALEDADPATKTRALVQLATVRGISLSKLHERHQRQHGQPQGSPNVTIVINTGPTEPPAIEASVEHIE